MLIDETGVHNHKIQDIIISTNITFKGFDDTHNTLMGLCDKVYNLVNYIPIDRLIK